MPNVTILTEDDLRSGVELDAELVALAESTLRVLTEGAVTVPPHLTMAIEAHHGTLDVSAAYVPGLTHFAIKVTPSFGDNAGLGLPNVGAMTVLLDSESGIATAVLLDNGYLTGLRAAAAGAVAAKHLAPAEIHTAGVIGAGAQAELQVQALKEVRDFSELIVWARGTGKSEAFALKIRNTLDISVRVAATAEDVVRKADVLITATPAEKPIIKRDWLRPGLHITAIGADAPNKNELDPRILVDADRFVCDSNDQSRAMGEMRAAVAAGLLKDDHVADEIGELAAGTKPGRQGEDEITICDLTGTPALDTAIAEHACRMAVQFGLGFEVEN